MSFDGRLLGGVGVMAAVVETGNFARAGDALGLTQSGVSRAIARLEMRIGVRLFDRTPRAVTLTDEGRRFHQSVVPLLTGLEDAATEAAGTAAVVRGRLRINVDPFFARLVLAPRLGNSWPPTLSCRWRSWDATVSATSWPTALTPLCVSASRSPRRSSHGGSLRQGSLPAPRPPTWPNTAARRIPASSARDGTNAFTTWTPSPAGRFTGNFTAAGCRRHASGEIDWSGRISKCGDATAQASFITLRSSSLTCRSTAFRASSNGLIAAISSGRPAINSSARTAKTLNLARPITRPRFLRRPRTWFSRSRLILTSSARLASSALSEWLSISWTSKPAGSIDSAGTSSQPPAPGQQPGLRECPPQTQVRREGTACRYFHNERAMCVEAQARPRACAHSPAAPMA